MLGRAVASHLAPGIGRPLVGDIAQGSLVGSLGVLLGRDFLRRFGFGGLPVSGNGLALSVSRASQQGDDTCSQKNSHPMLRISIAATKTKYGACGRR